MSNHKIGDIVRYEERLSGNGEYVGMVIDIEDNECLKVRIDKVIRHAELDLLDHGIGEIVYVFL